MSEADERLTGPRGAQGERGERGLPRRVAWAIVVLFLIGAGVETANLLWTAYEVRSASAAQRAEQAAQRRQGELLEQKLCTTLGRLAALNPPGGSPAGNPSRAYLQGQHDVLAQLGPDVGCDRRSR